MKEIIKGCKREDRQSQMECFRLLAPKMMTVCLRYSRDQSEAEDILQEGFIRVFDNVHQFKFEGSFEGWVRRVITTTAIRHYQKTSKRKETDYEAVLETESMEPSAFERLNERDLLELIGSLPDGFRTVFNLYAIEGYSHKEIGEKLGIKESASRSQYSRARKLLQNRIILLEEAI